MTTGGAGVYETYSNNTSSDDDDKQIAFEFQMTEIGATVSPPARPHVDVQNDSFLPVWDHVHRENTWCLPMVPDNLARMVSRTYSTKSQKKRSKMTRGLQGKWIDAKLKLAMDTMESGASIGTAVKFYGIPKTSLSDHVNGRTHCRKRGPKVVLNHEEEEALETYMREMADYSHLLTTEQLKLKVALLTQKRAQLDNVVSKLPSRSNSQALIEFRIFKDKGLKCKKVATFYKNLQQLYQQYKYPPTNIWNCDESEA